jgi:acyl-CoA thioesterase FadM
MGQRELRERFGIIGTGLVDASGRFLAPVTYGDTLVATSYVERWSRRSFTVYHRFDLAGTLAVEGREVRTWMKRDGAVVVAEPLPEEFKIRLGFDPARGGDER